MFVIACKWVNQSRLFELIDSIKKHQPNEKIVVVDSNSEDKSYFEKIKDDCIIEDISNSNYLEGALWYCYEKYKDENFFYLVQDSMILKKNIESFKENDVTHLSYFPYHYNYKYGRQMEEFCSKILYEKTDYKYFIPKYAIFGSTIYIKRELLDKLKNKGFNKVLPKNKMEMESLERLWAVVLEQEGYNTEEIGLIRNDKFSENEYFYKFWLDRQ
jgi:hypothetical protein